MELNESLSDDTINAEREVLLAMLWNASAITEVRTILTPQDFYRPVHEQIAQAIFDLHSQDAPTDLTAVTVALRDKGNASASAVLLELSDQVRGSAGGAGYYAKIVKREKIRRDGSAALTKCHQILAARGDGLEDPRTALTLAMDEIEAVIRQADSGEENQSWREIVTDALEVLHERAANPDETIGLSTGLRDLDDVLNGLRAGGMTVVAARPGHGKSVLAGQIASNAAKNGKGVLFVSREMSGQEHAFRWLSGEGRVPFHSIQNPSALDDTAWAGLAKAAAPLDSYDIPLWFDDKSDSVAAIEMKALYYRERARRGGDPLSLIVVDYLQILTPPPGTAGNPTEAISAMSRALKSLAMKMDCHVIAISSLTKGQAPSEPPTAAELRGSAQIEYDADNVLLLHNWGVADSESPRVGELDVNLHKARGQKTGHVTLAWQGHYQRAADLASERW